MVVTDFSSALGYLFIAVFYINFFLLAMWALARTYMVGPGYITDHFKSVKIEYLELMQIDNNSNNSAEEIEDHQFFRG